jgi:hypothetical protein
MPRSPLPHRAIGSARRQRGILRAFLDLGHRGLIRDQRRSESERDTGGCQQDLCLLRWRTGRYRSRVLLLPGTQEAMSA